MATRKCLRLHVRGKRQASELLDTTKAGPAQEVVVDVRIDYYSLIMEPRVLTYAAKEFPEDLLSSVYTHLNYAFAFVDPSSFKVAPMADLDVSLYPRFTALKNLNPGLETWVQRVLDM